MGDPINCVIIQSDRARRHMPEIGMLVRLHGQSGLFTVLSVDRTRSVADLLQINGTHRVLADISFSSIQFVDSAAARAVELFLHSGGQ